MKSSFGLFILVAWPLTGGWGFKALVAGPLKKLLFLRLPLETANTGRLAADRKTSALQYRRKKLFVYIFITYFFLESDGEPVSDGVNSTAGKNFLTLFYIAYI